MLFSSIIIRNEGKTTLTSFIIETLLGTEKDPVIYFYCKQDQPEKRTKNGVLRGLLAQLIKHDDVLCSHIYYEYSSVDETKLRSSRNLEDLLSLAFANQIG